MGWTVSKIFSAFIADALNGTALFNLDSDALKAALFNDTITPSQIVASASTAYGAGVWAGGGVSDAPSWPAVGRPIVVASSAFSSNIFTFDSVDTVSADATTDLVNVYGTLVYDDTLAAPVVDQGICFNYLGGPNTVTNGTFTIVWHPSGVLALTL